MTKRDKANEKAREYYHANKHNKPWVGRYRDAVRRCTDSMFDKFYLYGGKGIEVEMTMDDLKDIWFRDHAETMIKPSLARYDHDDNYTVDNCRFIEQSEHSIIDARERKNNPKEVRPRVDNVFETKAAIAALKEEAQSIFTT